MIFFEDSSLKNRQQRKTPTGVWGKKFSYSIYRLVECGTEGFRTILALMGKKSPLNGDSMSDSTILGPEPLLQQTAPSLTPTVTGTMTRLSKNRGRDRRPGPRPWTLDWELAQERRWSER